MTAADLVAGQHAQREVLRQVVTGENGVPEQRGNPVHEDGQREEHDDGREYRPASAGPHAGPGR